MIVLFDTSTLIFLLKPDAPAPHLPDSATLVPDCASRIGYLLSELQRSKSTIVVPTPVIAELLVLAGEAGPEWLQILTQSRHFRPAPFDTLAAVECAEMAKRRLGVRLSRAVKAKAKFDEQIVAIARRERATVIYSDDRDIRALVNDEIAVMGMADLPLPSVEAQGHLDLEQAPLEPPPSGLDDE